MRTREEEGGDGRQGREEGARREGREEERARWGARVSSGQRGKERGLVEWQMAGNYPPTSGANVEWGCGKPRKLPTRDFRLPHVVTRSDFGEKWGRKIRCLERLVAFFERKALDDRVCVPEVAKLAARHGTGPSGMGPIRRNTTSPVN